MTQRILITGASAGLGQALALEHAAQGHRLLLLARRRDKLTAVARACRLAGAPDVRVQAADVGRRADLDRAVRGIQRAWGGLDVAYANAGYSQSGRIEALSLKQWRAQMTVNVEGVLHTLQACLPLLRASRGCLGVTSSVVSYGSLAGSGAYAASKAAVRALIQVLDLELQGSGVSVTHIAPGFFASEIRLKDADGRPDPDAPEYIPRLILGDTAVLARRVRQAVAGRRRELVWPLHAKLAVLFLRWLPGLAQTLARRLSVYREDRKKAARKA